MELERGPESVRPRNALVATEVSRSLGDGVRFVREGFRVSFADGRLEAPGEEVGGKLFWANAFIDADVVVGPTPLGAEGFVIVRSAASPESYELRIGLPDGASLRPGPAGSAVAAEIVGDEGALGRIGRPLAHDLRGRPVPVTVSISRDVVRMSVRHRGGGVAYPVLVDPPLEGALVEESLTPSADGWTFASSQPGAFTGFVGNGSLGAGQYLESIAGASFADQDQGSWRYRAPRSAFVFRADFGSVANVPAAGTGPSCVSQGIYNTDDWERGGEWSEGAAVAGSGGPWSTCAAVSGVSQTHCSRPGCAWGGEPGSSAVVKQWMSGAGTRSSAGTVFMGGAAVYVTDDQAPYLVGSQAPSRWFSSGLASWAVDARDDGVGVSKVSYAGPGSVSGSLVNGCSGLQDTRCPGQWTPEITVDTAALSEGENAVSLTARDAIDRVSTALSTTIKVDRTAPLVGYSGALASLNGRTVATDVGVQVDAVDGSAASPRAGVESITVFVDGVQKDVGQQSCPQGSCSMSRSWVFSPAQYSIGAHVIRAVTTDAAGNQAAREFQVSVGAGRITSFMEGARTARRLVLAATGTGGQWGVRFQYRLGANDAWQDVPVETVRNGGIAVGSWPMALSGGESPSLVWDLVGSSGEPGMISLGRMSKDGSLQVRGVFDGGEGGSTQELWVTLDRTGASTRNATAPIGPGEVDLLTGSFSFSQTDVSIDAYKADLTVTRTYSSRNSGPAGVLGPGWKLGVPMEQASADYIELVNLAEDAPGAAGPGSGPEPYVIVVGSAGEEIVFSEASSGYAPEKGYETLKLTRVTSATDPGKVARFELTDSSSGEVMTFTGSAGNYRLSGVRLTGQANSASYVYEEHFSGPAGAAGPAPTRWELTRMIAPEPAGVDCDGALVRGCRALDFVYGNQPDDWGAAYRLAKITFTAWDPATSAMKTTTVARYDYDNQGRLYFVDDPRKGTSIECEFGYSGVNLTDIYPSFKAPWKLSYQSAATDPAGAGRLATIRRVRDYGSTEYATSTMRYDVAVAGAGAPHAMGAADVAAWGQQALPVQATAIFRPDDVPADPPASYAKATVHYLDALGRSVNLAAPAGHITTTESDASGNVVRELTAANRARALAYGSGAAEHAARAALLDTQRRFDADGIRLLDELGPEHELELSDGSVVRGRRHAVYAYDEGAPSAGGPYNLPTTVTVGARVAGESNDRDARTTKTEYDWALRAPTAQIVDPAGLNLRAVTVYDSSSGLPVETRMPRNPSGADASVTRTVYWTAGANPGDAACGERAEWAGLPCRTGPATQPGTPGLPELPVSRQEYGYLHLPTKRVETSGAATRTVAYGYDAAGRLASEETTGSEGASLGKITYEYESDGCGQLFRRRIQDGADTYDVIENHDYLCRVASYQADQVVAGRSSGGTTSQLRYDLVGRVSSRTHGAAQQTYSYDPIRGLAAEINDSEVGKISATYDADGQLTAETFASAAVSARTDVDETGTPVRRAYVKEAGCTTACTWLESETQASVHGQWLTHAGSLSGQGYDYDAAGRLTRVRDTPTGIGCTTRTYGFDADSNRTTQTSHPPAGDGACSSSTPGESRAHAYDQADRITSIGYAYDAFGRITSVPAADAGGDALTSSYYVNDRVRRLTQAGRSVTYELDALLRPRRRQENNANPEELYYADLSDEPAYSTHNGETTRNVDGIAGHLAAIVRRSGASTAEAKLQLSNLHGDIVGEAPLSTAATGPSATWETDEFGIPRKPVRPPAITQVGDAATSALSAPAATLTIAKPVDARPGDLLVAGVASDGGGLIGPPAGWTLAAGTYNRVQSGSSIYRVFWHVVGDTEPTSYQFSAGAPAGKHRGGIVALRNTDTTNPIISWNGNSGASGDAVAPGPTPAVDDAALIRFVGNDSGDTDAGGAWSFPSGHAESWDLSTGTTTSDRSHAAAIQILINGKYVAQPTATVTNQTGANTAPWGAITVAIAPKPANTLQHRYRYLGSKQRPMELPSGAVTMGARIYLPQLGRFLQTDPVPGGSANAYDYAAQDCVNRFDLDGLRVSPDPSPVLPSCKSFTGGGPNVKVGVQIHPGTREIMWGVQAQRHVGPASYNIQVFVNGRRQERKRQGRTPHGRIKTQDYRPGDVIAIQGRVTSLVPLPNGKKRSYWGRASCMVPW